MGDFRKLLEDAGVRRHRPTAKVRGRRGNVNRLLEAIEDQKTRELFREARIYSTDPRDGFKPDPFAGCLIPPHKQVVDHNGETIMSGDRSVRMTKVEKDFKRALRRKGW